MKKILLLVVFMANFMFHAGVQAETHALPETEQETLVLLSALDFERLQINLAEVYKKIYAETKVKIVLHSSDAEETLALMEFIQGMNYRLDALILPADQLARIQDRLVSLADYADALATIEPLIRNNTITIHDGFYLVLYYNKALIDNPHKAFSDFAAQELSMNFATAFSTQLFWNHYQVISSTGEVNSSNLERKLTQVFFSYVRLLTENTISPTCAENACINEDFLNKTSPYAIDGTWMKKTFGKALGDKLGMTSLPAYANSTSKAVRIPHVLGLLSPLSENQQQALVLLTQALRNSIKQFQDDVSIEFDEGIDTNKASYIPNNYEFLGCLFSKTNPIMPALISTTSYDEVAAIVATMNVETCL